MQVFVGISAFDQTRQADVECLAQFAYQLIELFRRHTWFLLDHFACRSNIGVENIRSREGFLVIIGCPHFIHDAEQLFGTVLMGFSNPADIVGKRCQCFFYHRGFFNSLILVAGHRIEHFAQQCFNLPGQYGRRVQLHHDKTAGHLVHICQAKAQTGNVVGIGDKTFQRFLRLLQGFPDFFFDPVKGYITALVCHTFSLFACQATRTYACTPSFLTRATFLFCQPMASPMPITSKPEGLSLSTSSSSTIFCRQRLK